MKLHEESKTFQDIIRAASQKLNIREVFVEKDYWITLVLNRLSESKYSEETVFKGGTSLSKGFNLINRFSEDVDLAIINNSEKSGNQIRTLIREVEKSITAELAELKTPGVTSKGSRFRKSVYEYPSYDKKNQSNKLIIEINSFANPFPYIPILINAMVFEFLKSTGNQNYIADFELQPFRVNVLDKNQTLLEKVISLIRISYSDDYVAAIKTKIRHFYDLFYLLKVQECSTFIHNHDFTIKLQELLEHDRALFGEPEGWGTKTLLESPLLRNFPDIWNQVSSVYRQELSALAYKDIPNEDDIAEEFNKLLLRLQ